MTGGKKEIRVSLADVQKARSVLREIIRPSPLLFNPWLSESMGCEIYLKLESMQPIGSFKIRGATYKISRLSAAERKRGVICASAGNHAQGVAWGSRRLKTHALIIMPKAASLMKIQNTRALGAEVRLAGETFDEACTEALKISRKTGRIFIHAFEDPDVIAGQGTLALEILDELPKVDMVVGSIGGGGMMSGVSTVLKALRPGIHIVGCQASGAPAMVRSLKIGRVLPPAKPDTFADGIAVAQASPRIMKILSSHVDELVEADDEAIAAAVLTLMEKAKVVVEGSGAVPLAALEKMRKKVRGKKVVLIVSGGNIDVNLLSRIIDRGLIRGGRRVRVNVLISDRTGSLARLTDRIAREGANIIQAIHDRSEPSTTIDQTDVALTLETRGAEHSESVIRALRECALRVDVVH